MDSTAGILMTLLASLLITSTLISFFTVAVLGYSVIGFELPQYSIDGASSSNNFVSSCSLAPYEIIGNWVCDSNGASLSGGGELKLLKNSSERIGQVFTNTYRLKTDGNNYYILISDDGQATKTKLYVKPDGFHLSYEAGVFGWSIASSEKAFIPFNGATAIREVTIKTVLDTPSNSLSFTFNNQPFTFTKDATVLVVANEVKYGAGVGADGSISLESLSTSMVKPQSVFDGLAMIASFVTNILAIIVWNIDPAILPWEINLLFIKTQCMGIFVALIALVRG